MVRGFHLICIALIAVILAGCEDVSGSQGRVATSLAVPPEKSVLAEKNSLVDYVVVQKKDRILSLWKNGRLIKTYPVLAMGDNPVGQKVHEGDERTPEGTYYIDEKHPSQNFQKFLKISYPNERDIQVAKRFGMPPGGNVGIHGDRGGIEGFWQRRKKDWTDGCLAMRNADVEEIYAMVDVGTPIMIKP